MEIRLENISKTFKNTVAVDDFSCRIAEGEMVCLLGPSGCGKSTTLSVVAGLEAPTNGEVYFDGRPMGGVAAEDRDIGMVFQNYALYPHMSVEQNIAFPLKMRRLPRRKRAERVRQVAGMMQISELLHRRPGQLSGGQQQRVAIARALVKQPQILLLDEPFSNLDARLRIELRDDIRQLQQQLGITTIFVTHDQEEAMSISDRIFLMREGKLQQHSSPQEMYRHPANLFVATFLGNPPINLLPCTWQQGRITVDGAMDWDLSSIQPLVASPVPSGPARLGIRPEDLVPVAGPAHLRAEIVSTQTLGKEIYLKLRHDDLTLMACLRWEQSYQVGDVLDLNVKNAHLFACEEDTFNEA